MEQNLDNQLNKFIKLGKILDDYIRSNRSNNVVFSKLTDSIDKATNSNPWFDKENIHNALSGISFMLKRDKLLKWYKKYENKLKSQKSSKSIAVIMAGNLPLVNFHDLLCVLISGHEFKGKLSSNDPILPVSIAELLIDINPEFAKKINFTNEALSGFDAVIATGSDNSARYFEYYFGKYPHIIRKNRSGLAIIDGSEKDYELKALSEDIFKYYGMGCRNVSKIMVPKKYDFEKLFQSMEHWRGIIDFNKYRNNYEYYKAIFLVNKTQHLDNGFMLLKEDDGLSSPLSVVYYQEYNSNDELKSYLDKNRESIQCIMTTKPDNNIPYNTIPFGKSQYPELWDYADGIDTMEFLTNLA